MIVVFGFFSLLLLVIAWSLSTTKETKGLTRRYIASIIGFSLAFCLLVSEVVAMNIAPRAWHLYLNEIVGMAAFLLNGMSFGMNNVIVDVCLNTEVGNPVLKDIFCSGHYLEFFGALILCFAMGSIFFTTQRKIIMLVDKGILHGIGQRLSNN